MQEVQFFGKYKNASPGYFSGENAVADNSGMMWRCIQMQLFDAEKLNYVQIIVIIIPTWIVHEVMVPCSK